MTKIPLSAIVVGYNEETLLSNCLNSITFCNEIIYYDLGSIDNSIAIANSYGASVHRHERVLSCEWIHSKYINQTRNEWVLIIDPDEVVDKTLADEIITLFSDHEISILIGAITVPWKFYFKNKRLLGTPWGGFNTRILIVNNHRAAFSAEIHVGRKLKEGYELLQFPDSKTKVVHHFWMRDFGSLLSKHRRYLKNEGQARYNLGVRSSIFKIILTPIRQFYFSFFTKKGYMDLGRGFILSVLWSWYQTSASIRVYQTQKNIAKAKNRTK